MMSGIRTPDQRLRVFVSSTLGELAAERGAVARAVSALRLTPVMFEAGARPHLPADLYRAYLAQSDVFIGLYWQRYGELVPELAISGLEEELELSKGMPRLFYLKTPAPDREPRLTDMIRRIRQEASYRHFRTTTELGRLVRDDLAQLLSERFAATGEKPGRPSQPEPSPPRPVSVPAAMSASTTSLFGRDAAIDEVAGLISRSDRRLITLTGPSGIGKTRLAVAVADRLRDRFGAGTVFVPLADVEDPEAVIPRIGWALGGDVATAPSPLDSLTALLGQDRWLLVLDNLDRLVSSGRHVAELVARSPGVAVLATSTTVLGLRAEHAYPVDPLPVPDAQQPAGLAGLTENPAVSLFLDRAHAVRPGFTPTTDDARAVAEICRRLEGHPLAIELAAARVRLLNPPAILRRLSRSFDTLGSGMVDLPERQRTLRATVEWSIGMLGPAERSLLEVLTVFADGWTVGAAAHVAALDEDRTLELTEGLARHSLLYLEGTGSGPRPRMLHTVRAFVAERLAARPDTEEVRRRHAEYYRALAESADRSLRGFRQRECADVLHRENENLTLAVRWHLSNDSTHLPPLFRSLSAFRVLWPFLGLGDAIIGDSRSWVAELMLRTDGLPPADRADLLGATLVTALEAGDAVAAQATGERLAVLLEAVDDPYLDAVSRLLMSWTSMLARDLNAAQAGLRDALDRLRRLDEPMWTALALLTSASVASALEQHGDSLRLAAEAHQLAERFDYPWLATVSHVVLGSLAALRDDVDEARDQLERALDLAVTGASTHCFCLVLAGSAALALALADTEKAGLLVGATQGLRRRAGLRVWAWMRGDEELAGAVRDAAGSACFDDLLDTGSQLSREESLELVRDLLQPRTPN
ncbi:DUF4062 domain-containing protein [Nocardioides sp. cx-173]|uniref:ATP-binding protein n=1 Tax=Nocardioides sp. cx-173 TaxID=2898796 RepID=UPI001E2BC98D|nr:DUF4062 domain-containing protein [Nocardioides sp. cx-173]MCD4525952.1 DUF4062 domain-containing protein [Nocardioides sp. cx-173]UGB43649.1 DUF4062 domain-containing protein [Nocardioides sp. cx-173]